MKPSPVRAFTLIELLVVVAIIAILAAIAVPNFLEAQVRSKVSRAKADMRSMATALESYRIDQNSYPPDGLDLQNPQPADYAMARRLAVITTPISYIQTLPTDPFHVFGIEFHGSEALFPGEAPYTYIYDTPGSFDGAHGSEAANEGQPQGFRLTSLGPSRAYDSFGTGPLAYDPTNGTVSAGDIFFFGSAGN